MSRVLNNINKCLRECTKMAFATAMVFGCGSKLKDETPAAMRKGIIGGVGQDAVAKGGRCKVSEPDAALRAKGFQKIDVNGLKLQTPDQFSKSLCDYLYDFNSDVMLVQFSGVTCLSCQDEAKAFASGLKIVGPYGNKVGHIVALTDFLVDYTEEDFKKFMADFAPQSIRAHDPEAILWKNFSKNPEMPTRPTIIAFNKQGLGYVINEEGIDPMSMIEVTKVLVDKQAEVVVPVKKPEGTVEPIPVSPTPTNPNNSNVVVPSPGGSSKLLSLTSSQNVAISDSSGQSLTLGQYFENADYLIVDISQFNCTYCRQLAAKHQADTAYQSMMNGSKCKALTVVPTGDLKSWNQAYAASTFVGKISRGIGNLRTIASAFGVSFGGTPTAFVIDRKGQLIDQQVGATPAKVASICK